MECCASNNESHFITNNALPSIHAPESPEINTRIFKNDSPSNYHDFELPQINSLKCESAASPSILASETAELNTPLFENGEPHS
jgi:hypothetical protein